MHGSQEFQVADGISVQADIALLLNAGDADDVLDVAVEGDVKVVQHSPCSHYSILKMLNAKALQILRLEVLQQLLAGKLLGEHPVIQLKRAEFIAESALKLLPQPSLEQHLLGREVVDQLLHIFKGTFSRQEFACGDIQKGYSARSLAEMDRTQEVVFLIVKHGVGEGYTWCHQFCNAALHQLLRQLGVLQLVTDSHAFPCTNQLGQIGIQGMMGEASHLQCLHGSVLAIIALGESNAQNFTGCNSIGGVGFIEIPTAEQQDGIRMLGLQVKKLTDHRGFFQVGCHRLGIFAVAEGYDEVIHHIIKDKQGYYDGEYRVQPRDIYLHHYDAVNQHHHPAEAVTQQVQRHHLLVDAVVPVRLPHSEALEENTQ